jgi:hypothetical protein
MVLSYLQLFPCPANHWLTCVYGLAALFRGTSHDLCSPMTSGTLIGFALATARWTSD